MQVPDEPSRPEEPGVNQTNARYRITFAALILAQVAHSIEEYAGRSWETFAPARFLSGLLSQERELGFILINASVILFGIWSFLVPVRRGWPSAFYLAWGWAMLELLNGTGHLVWSLRSGGYTPGLGTAPILLLLALLLMLQLRGERAS